MVTLIGPIIGHSYAYDAAEQDDPGSPVFQVRTLSIFRIIHFTYASIISLEVLLCFKNPLKLCIIYTFFHNPSETFMCFRV